MTRKQRKPNGGGRAHPKRKVISKSPRRSERDKTALAREKVLKEAKRLGVISNALACKIGKFGQAWYHLHQMEKAGQLKKAGYNQWMPARR